VKRQRETGIVGIVHQESDNAPLELLSGLQIAGITYLEKEPNELKLVSASNADVGLLSHRIAAGVLYPDANTADVQLQAGSKIVGMVCQEKRSGLKLLPVGPTGLQLLSGEKVKGVLCQEEDGADVKLLNGTMDLSVASGETVLGILCRSEASC